MKKLLRLLVGVMFFSCISIFNVSYIGADNINDLSAGELNDYLTDKLADMADCAHEDLMELANVVSTATAAETANTGGSDFEDMIDSSGNVRADDTDTGIISKLSIDADNNVLYIELIELKTKHKHLYFCYTDSPLVPLIISAYETLSICNISSRETNYYTAKEIYFIVVKRSVRLLHGIMRLGNIASQNGYSNWNEMADDFNRFGMGRSLGGLTAGSPIRIQAVQTEIQTKIDAATSVSKSKTNMQKKISQQLQSIGQ